MFTEAAMSMPSAPSTMAGFGSLGNWWDDYGKDLIGQGFGFGETFLKYKYAKDASRSTGVFSPQGQTTQTQPTYAQIPTGANAPQGTTPVSNVAGGFAASLANFVENNIGILAIFGVFMFAWQRPPRSR